MITIEGHDYEAEKELAENRLTEARQEFSEWAYFKHILKEIPNYKPPRIHNGEALRKEIPKLLNFLEGLAAAPAAPTGIAVTHAPCPLCKYLVERDSLKIAMEGKPPVCVRCAVKIIEAIESQRWEGLRHE